MLPCARSTSSSTPSIASRGLPPMSVRSAGVSATPYRPTSVDHLFEPLAGQVRLGAGVVVDDRLAVDADGQQREGHDDAGAVFARRAVHDAPRVARARRSRAGH